MATAAGEEISKPCWRERKMFHESSEHIYPKCQKNGGLNIPRKYNIDSFGSTSYSIDFAKKEGRPALPRPCSVTRRNRPHPSQNFLNWRIPSKPMPGQKVNDASKAFLYLSDVETRQRFYDDYVGRFNSEKTGKLYQDVCCLVPRYPTRPKATQQPIFQGKNNVEAVPSSRPKCIMTPLCVSKVAGQRYDSLVSQASSKERLIVESCLDAGDRGYLGKSLAHAIRPEAIPAIHRWLKHQNGTDRDVAVDFLNKLSRGTNQGGLETDRKYYRLQQICVDNKTSQEVSRAGRNAIMDQVRQMLINEPGPTERRRPTKVPLLKKNKKTSRFPMCPPRGFVINKNALFMQPYRCLPRHFEIHPEFHGITTK
ncbi:hypothetical protein ABFA07_015060 [Porites harrisoni]